MPTMSSMVLLWTRPLSMSRMTMTSMEPIKAAMIMASTPATCMSAPSMVVPTTPPIASMTSATPRDAPLVMPRMEGPANGFRKTVCSMSPLAANEAPHSKAVTACGRRALRTIYSHDAFETVSPVNALKTSAMGIRTVPTNRLRAKSRTIDRSMRQIFLFYSSLGCEFLVITVFMAF